MVIERLSGFALNARKFQRTLAFLSFTVVGANVLNGAEMAGDFGGPEYIPGRYIVTFKDKSHRGKLSPEVDSVARRPGVRMQHVYSHALNGFAAYLSDEVLEALKNDPRVESIEQDQVVRIDQRPRGGGGSSGSSSSQIIPWGITRVGLGVPITGSVNVDIAIIDTGIQPNHPDLNVVGGANFVTGGASTAYADGNGHGTHVAGTAAAKNNTVGVVGVAPGARLWAVRVLGNNGSGTISAVISGVNWVTANASTIEVANMSLSSSTSTSLNSAIASSVAAGVTYVVSAGNSSVDVKSTSPANNTNTGVITVSAMSSSGAFYSLSNRGLNYVDDSGIENGVDVIAPGVSVISTYINSGYASLSGTSMAAPHVTGAAALCKVQNPSYTPADVKQAVMTSPPSGSWDLGPAGIFGLGTWRATSGDPDGFYEPLVNAAKFAP